MKTGGESERWEMSRGKRTKREQTQNWGQIEQYSLWPEQIQYELIRPCVLFHESVATRAQETGLPARTISRQVKHFDEQGMVSLFATPPQIAPPDLRHASTLDRGRRQGPRREIPCA